MPELDGNDPTDGAGGDRSDAGAFAVPLTRAQAIASLASLISQLESPALRKASLPGSPVDSLVWSARSIISELEKGKYATWSRIQASWRVLRQNESHPIVNPWLRKHSRRMIDFFLADQRSG